VEKNIIKPVNSRHKDCGKIPVKQYGSGGKI
jgi:hypothetical protein